MLGPERRIGVVSQWSNDLLVLFVEFRNVLKVFRGLCEEGAVLQDVDDMKVVPVSRCRAVMVLRV